MGSVPLIGVQSRGVLFIPFVSEAALFLPGIAPGLPPFLPFQLLSCLNKAGHVGKILTGQPTDEAGGAS